MNPTSAVLLKNLMRYDTKRFEIRTLQHRKVGLSLCGYLILSTNINNSLLLQYIHYIDIITVPEKRGKNQFLYYAC